jgi:hypothetical protein
MIFYDDNGDITKRPAEHHIAERAFRPRKCSAHPDQTVVQLGEQLTNLLNKNQRAGAQEMIGGTAV